MTLWGVGRASSPAGGANDHKPSRLNRSGPSHGSSRMERLSQEKKYSKIEAPAGQPGTPVFIRIAIRNPLSERRTVSFAVVGVSMGWRVYFPHSCVWLDAKANILFVTR